MLTEDERRAIELGLEYATRQPLVGVSSVDDVLEAAVAFASLMRGAVVLRVTIGGLVDYEPDAGGPMQLPDNKMFTLSWATDDSRGFATADAVGVTDSTSGAVVSVEMSADGKSALIKPVAPGSTVLTLTDSSVTPNIVATEAIDVITSGTTAVNVTEGPLQDLA
jgi:hypothetical protein